MFAFSAYGYAQTEKEKDSNADKTQHEVTLTKAFYIGKYEVTQDQWEAVMGDNPSNTKGAKLPVTDVSWKDCQEFSERSVKHRCQKAN